LEELAAEPVFALAAEFTFTELEPDDGLDELPTVDLALMLAVVTLPALLVFALEDLLSTGLPLLVSEFGTGLELLDSVCFCDIPDFDSFNVAFPA
jgi:hypothetical protein